MEKREIPDFERARDFAVRYLGYAPRTCRQLKTKMAEKEFSAEAIEAVVQLLTDKGYLDDVAFARNYITNKTRYSNYGRRRIVVDLLQRGVSKEDIQAAYEAVLELDEENNNELEAAKRALAKRLGRKGIDREIREKREKDEEHKERQRLMAYLMRRGFSYDTAKKAFEEDEERS